jgi:sterol desaturase/sphingolipid hydroxylase (fatty acid hydroxylase superfamily)
METVIRLGSALAIFAAMALWEWRRPRLTLAQGRGARWPINLGITLLDLVLVRLTVGAAAVGAAGFAAEHGWGLFHLVAVPGWIAFAASWALLDFAIYLQHILVHAVPVLWRLHQVHHADLGFDVTTGLRFHPLEIFLSLGIKVCMVALIGPPIGAVILFEVLLNAGSLFNHGNVDLPVAVDRWLRWLIVTPDMHRVHHSVVPAETNSNFGFSVSIWDRLCGTYRAQPAAGHEAMTIGVAHLRDPARLGFFSLLWLPFTSRLGSYSFRGRGGSNRPSPADGRRARSTPD